MVTLRRDIAVTKNVSADAAVLTAYDKFLVKKNTRRNVEFASVPDKMDARATKWESSYVPTEKEAMATKTRNKVAIGTESEYDKYLLSQLNRPNKNQKLMSEEEFYESGITAETEERREKRTEKAAPVRAVKQKKEVRVGKLTRIGKIILSTYVLVVLFAAFTLIAVNVFSEPVVADAEENVIIDGERTIRPMTLETLEKEEGNWFDNLCDTVKK